MIPAPSILVGQVWSSLLADQGKNSLHLHRQIAMSWVPWDTAWCWVMVLETGVPPKKNDRNKSVQPLLILHIWVEMCISLADLRGPWIDLRETHIAQPWLLHVVTPACGGFLEMLAQDLAQTRENNWKSTWDLALRCVISSSLMCNGRGMYVLRYGCLNESTSPCSS